MNGSHHDIIMDDVATETPVTTPGPHPDSTIATNESTVASTVPSNDQPDDQPPPAKRARMHSDADKASVAHVSHLSLCAPMQAC